MGNAENERGMIMFAESHDSDTQDQLASMPGSILLLSVTELLNHSPFFLFTAHQDLPHPCPSLSPII